MFIYTNSKLCKVLRINGGICILGLIFIASGYHTLEVENHERIHRAQQIEGLFVFTYLLYLVEYLIRCFGSIKDPYVYLSMEREAKLNQHDCSYLYNRKPYAYLKHIFE